MEQNIHAERHHHVQSMEKSFSQSLVSEMDKIIGKGSYSLDVKVFQDQSLWSVEVLVKSSRGSIGILKRGNDLDYVFEDVHALLLKKAQLWKEQSLVDTFRLNSSPEFEMYSAYKNGNINAGPYALKVLVVEDDPVSSQVVQVMLSHIGCSTTVLSNPDDVLKELQAGNYDLMVLDWNLPYKSGKELLLELDASLMDTKKKLMPVILCSSLNIEEMKFPEVKKFFLIDYWSKKISFSSVVSSVEKTINALKSGI